MRWEVRRGHVIRVGCGLYQLGRLPETTRWRARQRLQAALTSHESVGLTSVDVSSESTVLQGCGVLLAAEGAHREEAPPGLKHTARPEASVESWAWNPDRT